MAVKKTTSKSAAPKGKAKPAVKASKAAPAKKPAAKAKSAAPAKPAKKAEVKKPAPKAAKKPEIKKPAAKPAPAKKPAAKPAAKAEAPKAGKKAPAPAPAKAPKAVKQTPAAQPAVVAKAAVVEAPKPAPVVSPKTSALPKKAPTTKPRSSVVDFPAPPAPVKPPFVPPKPAPKPAEEPAANGANGGSHSPAFVQKQRQRLLDLRDDLVDAVSGMARDTIRNAPEGSEASGSGQHQGDAGSDAYDRDFALSVLAKEQDALYEIEQALRRIQTGTYGICEMSSRKIPQARLEAIPFARLTVECQAQWEKEYGNRRFRPSNEVGFSGGNYVEDDDSETVSLDEDED